METRTFKLWSPSFIRWQAISMSSCNRSPPQIISKESLLKYPIFSRKFLKVPTAWLILNRQLIYLILGLEIAPRPLQRWPGPGIRPLECRLIALEEQLCSHRRRAWGPSESHLLAGKQSRYIKLFPLAMLLSIRSRDQSRKSGTPRALLLILQAITHKSRSTTFNKLRENKPLLKQFWPNHRTK